MRLKLLACLVLSLTGWLTTACPAPCDLEDNEVSAIHTDGAQITAALDAFRASEQKYPQRLEELTPKYMDKVPEKIGGRKFSYSVNDAGKYNLRVASPSGGGYSGACSYSEIEDRWRKLLQSK